jgi:hypothetical protein
MAGGAQKTLTLVQAPGQSASASQVPMSNFSGVQMERPLASYNKNR